MLYFEQFCKCPKGCSCKMPIRRKTTLPVLCFSSGIPVASAEHGAGTFCHWVMAFVLALEKRWSDRMYNVPVARKVCATCKWWRGKRELKFIGGRLQAVEVDNITPKGHTCRAWNQERGATHQCNRWTQWERM